MSALARKQRRVLTCYHPYRFDAPLAITPESVRETIAVLETCRRQNPAIWEET